MKFGHLFVLFSLIHLFTCANIQINNCLDLDNITSSNNYLLNLDLDCVLSGSIIFINGIFGKFFFLFANLHFIKENLKKKKNEDGGNHKLIQRAGSLFFSTSNVIIRNLRIENLNLTSTSGNLGGLVGTASNTTIDNVHMIVSNSQKTVLQGNATNVGGKFYRIQFFIFYVTI